MISCTTALYFYKSRPRQAPTSGCPCRLLLRLRCRRLSLRPCLLLLYCLLLHQLRETGEYTFLLGAARCGVAASTGEHSAHTGHKSAVATAHALCPAQHARTGNACLLDKRNQLFIQSLIPGEHRTARWPHLRGSFLSVSGQRGRRSTHSPSPGSLLGGGGSTRPSCSLHSQAHTAMEHDGEASLNEGAQTQAKGFALSNSSNNNTRSWGRLQSVRRSQVG